MKFLYYYAISYNNFQVIAEGLKKVGTLAGNKILNNS